MKDARNIFALVALAFSLGVYDVLKERMNFSTVVSLIVVLIFFAIWLVVFILLNKFVFNKNTEGVGTEQVNPQIHSVREEMIHPEPNTDNGAEITSRIISLKAQKKRNRSTQKAVELKKSDEKKSPVGLQPLAEPVTPVEPESSSDSHSPAVPVTVQKPILTAPVTAHKLSEQKRVALEKILTTACLTPGISGAAIVTHGGILLASTTLSSSRKDLAIGICASIFALGTRMSNSMGRKQLKELVVRGDDGFLFFRDIAEEAFLILIVEHSMLIGGIIQLASRCAENAASVLQNREIEYEFNAQANGGIKQFPSGGLHL